MGCTTSMEARRDMRWAEGAARPRAGRNFSLPSVDRQRLRSKAASVLGNLGLAPGRHSGVSYKYNSKYATISVEEIMMACENDLSVGELLHVKEVGAARRTAVKPHTPANTPTNTPPTNEPEVINAWELMAGLEDEAPTPSAQHQQPPTPPWLQADVDIPIAFEFDAEILSGFGEVLADTPPSQPIVSSPADEEPAQQVEKRGAPVSHEARDMPELSGIVRARIRAFQEKTEQRAGNGGCDPKVAALGLGPPGGKRKAVVYFTSLRGVRKTFMNCCAVRSILRSYKVCMDERDVSMHAVFKSELAQLLGPALALAGGGTPLPCVFVDGRYLGGAEDVQMLHEAGELGGALEGCEAAPVRKLGYMEACVACGDVRFVPCDTCYGSCKIFVEENDDGAGEFRRCPDCNENGLIGCPVCCC